MQPIPYEEFQQQDEQYWLDKYTKEYNGIIIECRDIVPNALQEHLKMFNVPQPLVMNQHDWEEARPFFQTGTKQ